MTGADVDLVADLVSDALAPMLADLKAVQYACAQFDARWNDLGALRERVAVLETRAPIPGPSGPAGAPGAKGDPGVNGKDGADGLNGKDGSPGVNGKDGADGLSGKDGAPGQPGQDGANGLHGKDGAGIADAMIDREGYLVLTFTDGRTKSVGIVVGKDGIPGLAGKDGSPGRDGLHGKDGAPGAPGLSPEDVDWDFNPDTRAFTLKLFRGGVVVAERTKTLEGMRIYRGVYEQGKAYAFGDVVTWGGSEWTAMAQTTDRPGNGATEWKLCVKHGDQGKIGPEGKPGRDGRDLTNTDGKGGKWGR